MDTGDDGTAVETVRVRFHGRVQGVGFRDGCLRRAAVLGLTGWVRNRGDGSVEAMLQGPPERVAELCERLRAGAVPAARVDAVEVVPVRGAARCEGFERRPTH